MEKKAYIARNKNGNLYIYTKGKPYKGACIWGTSNPDYAAKIDNNILHEIKWDDKEPTEVTIEIVRDKTQQSQEKSNTQTKFDPKTLKPFDKVLVKCTSIYNSNLVWRVGVFSYFYVTDDSIRVYTLGSDDNAPNSYVIPYNDETKHLVNTTEEAPEYYRYWD